MEEYHRPYNKKVGSGTGARKRKYRDKKLAHMGGVFASARVSDEATSTRIRGRGGKTRMRPKKVVVVNVVGKDGKVTKVKIVRVVESHNPEYVRRNIITKGAVLETELGKVRVTNRVGQDGVVNGVLVS